MRGGILTERALVGVGCDRSRVVKSEMSVYIAPDGTMMAIPVIGTRIEFGKPAALFQFFTSQNRGTPAGAPPYDVTADGRRFIVSAVVRRNDPSIQVLLNWPALMNGKTAP